MMSSFQSVPHEASAIFSSSTPSFLTVILPEPAPISVTVRFQTWMVLRDVTVEPSAGSVFQSEVPGSSPPPLPIVYVKVTAGSAFPEPSRKNPSGTSNV